MRKFLLVVMGFFLMSCVTKAENVIPIQKKYDDVTSIALVEGFISKQFAEKGYVYHKTLHNLKEGVILFSWRNDRLNKYYIRYFIFSGDKRYVNLEEKDSKYILSIRNASVIVNCYGYTHNLPKVVLPNMKINFEEYSSHDCKSAIRYVIDNKEEAMNLASAFMTVFGVREEVAEPATKVSAPAAKEKPATKVVEPAKTSDNNTIPAPTNKCSVEKILKMKDIGLTIEEIKKVCE